MKFEKIPPFFIAFEKSYFADPLHATNYCNECSNFFICHPSFPFLFKIIKICSKRKLLKRKILMIKSVFF